MPDIIVQDLRFSYPKRFHHSAQAALKGFSATFLSNKVNVILGASGSGKSTLLRILLGLEDDYDGGIAFGEKNADDIKAKDRNIGYVPQEISLHPRMTIFQNIAFPLMNLHAPGEEIRERVEEVAELMGIAELLVRKPKELSVGQNQRAAIAKALIRNPKYLFFDEPFSHLDKERAEGMQRDIKPILNSRNITSLYVTHNVTDALLWGDYIFVMEDGKLLSKGTPGEVFESKDPAVQGYFQELER